MKIEQLLNQLHSYCNTPLPPLFASLMPYQQSQLIRNFCDPQNPSDYGLLDFEADANAVLAYNYANTRNLIVTSENTGEIYITIPVTPTATKDLSYRVPKPSKQKEPAPCRFKGWALS